MKSSTVVILMAGFIAYMWISQRPQQPYLTGATNPQGGLPAAQPDTFQSILGAVSAVFGAVGSIAQTQSKTQ